MTQPVLPDGIVADVHFERKAADESYGNETAAVTIHVPIPSGLEEYDIPEAIIASALATARRLVHDELRQSPSPRVRRAVEYPLPPEGRRVPVQVDTVGVAGDVADIEDLPF